MWKVQADRKKLQLPFWATSLAHLDSHSRRCELKTSDSGRSHDHQQTPGGAFEMLAAGNAKKSQNFTQSLKKS